MSDPSEPGPTSEETRGGPGSETKLWLLLGADRRLLAALVLGGLFAAFVALGTVGPASLRAAANGKDPIETLFQALLTATVTGVTLVVTIGQLVLSQELGAVGDQRDRMEGATAFRRDAEALLDDPVSPAAPAAFLRALLDAVDDRAADLDDAAGGTADAAVRDRVSGFAADVSANAEGAGGRLADARFGTFDVVAAALDFDYSRTIHEARRLRRVHGDVLSADARDALDEIVAVLELFGPAREHVKTLYFQWALIDLSRAVVYASVPALAVSVGMILYATDPAAVTGATLGVDDLVLLVSAATAIALSPFAILLSYVLRIVTVAKRTLAIGPFVLQDGGRDD